MPTSGRFLWWAAIWLAGATLSGCGGGSGGSGPAPAPRTSFSLGGTVSGLRGTDAVTLRNGGENLRILGSGPFSFGAKLANGAAYDVSAEAPPGYVCKVRNNAGVIAGADVTNVQAYCQPFLLAGAIPATQDAHGIAIDAAGNSYVLDTENQLVLKFSPSGVPSVVAGTQGVPGYRDGKGLEAKFHFNELSSIAMDSIGNLGITDTCNGAIRKMTPEGVVSTIAGGTPAVFSCRNYTSGPFPQPRDGAGKEAIFTGPVKIASDRAGGFIVTDLYWPGIRRVSAAGVVRSLRLMTDDTFQPIFDLAQDPKGDLYFSDDQTRIWKLPAGGTTPVFIAGGNYFDRRSGGEPADGLGAAAQFAIPSALAIGPDGDLYVGDWSLIRKVSPLGAVTTIAGSFGNQGTLDGAGKAAQLRAIRNMAFDPQGNLVLVQDRGAIRRMTPTALITTVETTKDTAGYVDGVSGEARINSVRQPAVGGDGNLYVADPVEHVIRKITPDGAVSLYAGARGTRGHQDGSLATATFDAPSVVAAGPGGSLFIGDASGIRRISDGVVSTLAPFKGLFAIAVDASGNVAVSDSGAVYRIRPSGEMESIVDWEKLMFLLKWPDSPPGFNPQGLAYDGAGNLFISDTGSVAVYRLGPDGQLSLFAGTPMVEGDRDGPPGTATFGYYGVDEMTIDPNGNLYLSGQGQLRKISPAGVTSTLALPWGNPNLHGLAWGNGTLYGMTKYAVLQVPVQ